MGGRGRSKHTSGYYKNSPSRSPINRPDRLSVSRSETKECSDNVFNARATSEVLGARMQAAKKRLENWMSLSFDEKKQRKRRFE